MTDGAPGYHSMSPDRAPMSPPPEELFRCSICGAHWWQSTGADPQVHHEGCANWREGDTRLPRPKWQEKR